MFDLSWTEIALLVVVSLIFIGPKDLPVAMRALSKGIRTVKRMASEFQQHIDEMVREADLSETRDQLNELRQFNLRDQVRRAVDPHDDIRRHVESNTASQTAEPGMPPPPDGVLDDEGPAEEPYNARMKARAEALEKAPVFLPPTTALRLIEDVPHWKRPAILPPEIALHEGRRVPIMTEISSTHGPQGAEQVMTTEKKEDEHGRI